MSPRRLRVHVVTEDDPFVELPQDRVHLLAIDFTPMGYRLV